jgi:glycosyltransferase involved in cell wall biosynthesis
MLRQGDRGEEDIDGIRVYRYKSVRRDGRLFYMYPAFAIASGGPTIARVIRREAIDVINFHDPYSALGTLLFGDCENVPKIYTFHAPMFAEYAFDARGMRLGPLRPLLVWLLRLVEGVSVRRMDTVVTLSRFMAAEAAKLLGRKRVTIVQIPGGVDLERFNTRYDKALVRASFGLPLESFVFFTARRLVRRMGLEELIGAFKIVRDEFPDALLLIAGAGWMRARLKAQIEQSGLGESCWLLGYVAEDVLPKYFQACDAVVLPTVALEGFGMVILEAFASGKPVVGTPVAAIPELLSLADAKLLTFSPSSQHLAEKMAYVRQHPEASPAGARLVRVVEDSYTREHVGERYESLFKSMLNRGVKSPAILSSPNQPRSGVP